MPDPGSLRLSRQDGSSVATGFASGDRPTPELAAQAVHDALAKVDANLAGSVLLFLTHHFRRHAQAAISAAARAGRCLQVAGCTAQGVLTESSWSLEAPAAAALVLCGDMGLVRPAAGTPRLTLTTAEASPYRWLDDTSPRLGLLSAGGEEGAPGCTWLHGRIVEDGLCEASFARAQIAVGASRGLRALTGSMTITEVDGHEIFGLDGEPALAALLQHLPSDRRAPESLSLSHLFAAVTPKTVAADEAMAQGNFHLLPILAASHDEQSLSLALPLTPGDRVFWVSRQPAAAEQDSRQVIAELAAAVPMPDFALVFACIGRGPYFFGGTDRDLALLGERFPGLPIIGAYGNGEIAPLPAGNALISYSTVMALVTHVQS